MVTFVTSVAIMLAVVGVALVWAIRADRRLHGGAEDKERRSHAGDHRQRA